jgi:hypothetical protein
MILKDFPQLLWKILQDHEIAAVQAGPHARMRPVQPLWRSTLAISLATRHGSSVTSVHPYRSVTIPIAALALSRRTSRQRDSAGWAARPSSSTSTPNPLYRLSR